MICCSYNTNLLMQLFIRAPCLRPGVVVSLHRFINQARGRSNPSNYRGICVSSCLGKLFCSILYQRLLERVVSRNILHKSQIGFLPIKLYSRPYFTRRTLIDKRDHNHNEKVYACFVDFRKAFDSVWHDQSVRLLL